MEKRPIQILNRRYALLERLGEGGQGTVFAVRDAMHPDRPTALKRIAPDVPEALLLFEFEKLAAIDHPHFAKVYDLGRIESDEGAAEPQRRELFFTQELVAGAAADRWLESLRDGDRPRGAAAVVVAVARALAALHGCGILHGDVKPSNIVVAGEAADPKVKLVDLGLARRFGAMRGVSAGTPGFTAPEALAGFAEARSDLYGLGATIGRLVSWLPAFDPRTEALRGIGRRLAAARPEDRYDTAREVALAVGRAVGAEILGTGRADEILDASSDAGDLPAEPPIGSAEDSRARDAAVEALSAAIRTALAPGSRRPGLVFVAGPSVPRSSAVRKALVAIQIEAAAREETAPVAISGRAEEVMSAVLSGAGARGAKRPIDDLTLREAALAIDRFDGPLVCSIDDADTELGAALVRRIAASEPSHGRPTPLCLVVALDSPERARDEADFTGGELIAIPKPPGGEVSGLAGIAPGAQSAVEALAAIGVPAAVDEVVAVAGLDGGAPVLEAARALGALGLLVDGRGGDRIGLSSSAAASILGALDGERARRLCERAFDALSTRAEVDAPALARCAMGALLDEPLRRWAQIAADGAAARGDLGEALYWLESLRDRAGLDERRTLSLATLHRQTGSYDRAAALASTLVGSRAPEIASSARLQLAAVRRLTGRSLEALESLDGLADGAAPEIASEALALEARIHLERGDTDAAERALAKLSEGDETTRVLCGATAAAGLLAWYRGDLEGARRRWTAGRDTARRLGATAHEARLHGLLGMAAHVERRFAEARRCYETALALADRAGDAHGAAAHAVNLAAAATELGDASEALVRYREGMSRLSRIGRRDEVAIARANHAQLLLRLGDLESADRATRRLEEEIRARGLSPASSGLALCVRADVLLEMGEPSAARDRLVAALDALGPGGGGSTGRACERHLVAASLATGDLASAEEALASLGGSAGAPTEEERLAVAHLELAVALARGIGETRALDSLLCALPAPEESPLDAAQLEILLDAARAARAAGRPDAVRELADRAERLAERLRRATPSLHRPQRYPALAALRTLAAGAEPRSAGFDADGGSAWARLVRINTRLNSETRVPALLDLIMDNALEVTSAERGFLLVRDPRGELRVRCARNIDRERLSSGERSYSRGVAERVFETGEPIATTDAGADARVNEFRSVLSQSIRYIIAVPLQVRGRTDGVIYVDSRLAGRFDDSRLALLTAFADQAALALTNARLRAENRRRQTRIEKLNRALSSKLERREDELSRAKRDLERRTAQLEGVRSRSGLVGGSPRMMEVRRFLDRIAGADVPVVVSGESGTGKELAARAIHAEGPRRQKPFVAENCAAIPEALLESILFGHARGAFTGATRDAQGLFVEADKGTLFLDEIGEMPLALQAKLLRVLQDGEVRPLGGSRTIHVDVRVIAATNRDLAQLVADRKFRDDLYYRLHVMELRMPRLKERPEDIPELVEHFLAKHGKGRDVRLEAEALEALTAYHWPGNVRQLENEIIRALVLCEGRLGAEHLSDAVTRGAAPEAGDDFAHLDMDRHLDALQRRLVRTALDRAGGNRTKAAALLGVSRFGLQKMVARLGI